MFRNHRAVKLAVGLFTFLALSLNVAPEARADFELLDAIQEFGERRFYYSTPAKIKVGPVKVHPFLNTKVTYDDNILLEDRDEREDVVFNIKPGIILDIPINRHQIAIGYEADLETFSKSRHAKQTDQNQNMFALIDLNFPSFYINILENFLENSGRAGTTFTERIPRYDNSFHPKIGIRLNRFILEFGYRHFIRDFRRQIDDSLDFQLNEFTTVLYYDLFARLKALIEGQVSQIDYDDNFQRNGTFTQTRVGVEGEIIPNLTIKARAGLQFRNYETESKPDFNSWVASLSLEYLMRDRLKFTLSAERVPVEATFANVNFYKRHILRFGTEYELTPKWVLFQGMKLYRDDYTERAAVGNEFGMRRDTHFSSKLGVRYIPQTWWELEAAYEFFYRNSNFDTFDYTNNRFSLTSRLTY